MTSPAAPGEGTRLSRRGFLGLTTLSAAGLGLAAGAEPAVALAGQGEATTSAIDAGTLPEQAISTRRPLRIYGDDSYPAYFRRALTPSATRARQPHFASGRSELAKGTVHREGALPIPCDIIQERNVPIVLRDGTTIYADVFRPTGQGRHPAILAYGAYGKELGGQWLDDIADRSGVALSLVSELQRFEGPDPAYWVNHGYAVVHPDPRGINRSEGEITYWGRQLAEDGYDVVEWIAGQAWCTAKVAMSGNSYLAVSQWFIAAERPPHLAAIAPWEGFSDHFREAGNRGGIPSPAFAETILATIAGERLIEDQPRMMVEDQLLTPYWRDKTARLSRITVPAYVVASWTNSVHTHGTLAGFRQISSRHKWLRVHNTQEWVDYYDPAHVEELRQFFDHYLKGIDNNWERTPTVRLSVLDPGGTDTVDRAEREFPLARTRYQKLYLATEGQLSAYPVQAPDTVRYDIADIPLAVFEYTFAAETELTGYMSLRLWVEAVGSDDMELAMSVQKLDAAGNSFPSAPMVSLAATGLLRVSQRRLDRRRSTPAEPLLAHTDEQRLRPGQIVPVDVNIWPMGMRYHAGERLQLIVAASGSSGSAPDLGFGTAPIMLPEDGGTHAPGADVPTTTFGGSRQLPGYVLAQRTAPVPTRNKGSHVLHFGGRYDSQLLVPVVAPG